MAKRIELIWEQTAQDFGRCRRCGQRVMDFYRRPMCVTGKEVNRECCLVCNACGAIVATMRYAAEKAMA